MKVKTETFLKITLCHSSLSLTYNRYENRHQLVRLVYQRLQLISSAKSCSFQQLQPICCLLEFLHASFNLANEIWIGLGALRFPKCAPTEVHLLPHEHGSYHVLWNSRKRRNERVIYLLPALPNDLNGNSQSLSNSHA